MFMTEKAQLVKMAKAQAEIMDKKHEAEMRAVYDPLFTYIFGSVPNYEIRGSRAFIGELEFSTDYTEWHDGRTLTMKSSSGEFVPMIGPRSFLSAVSAL